MKIKDLLTETPQLIGPLDDHDIKPIEDECVSSLKNKTCKEIKRFNPKTSLYLLSKGVSNGCYFLASALKIDYLVNFKKVELNKKVLPNGSGFRQILVKRFPNASTFATGIAATIFWDYLFKESKCLISDIHQTDDGKQFWEYRIKEAFEKKLIVRMIDTNDNTFVDIKNAEELEDLNGQIWGKSKWFRRIIIAIFE